MIKFNENECYGENNNILRIMWQTLWNERKSKKILIYLKMKTKLICRMIKMSFEVFKIEQESKWYLVRKLFLMIIKKVLLSDEVWF